MKKYLPLLILLTIVYSCSSTSGQRSLIKIYPLSPYIDSVKFDKDEDVGSERKNGVKTKFFIINESVDYTDLTKDRIQDFIKDSLQTDLRKYKAIYFTFYEKSSSLHKDFQQTKDDMLSSHSDNKFAEFEYLNGKLYNFDFYKDGAYYEPTVTKDDN